MKKTNLIKDYNELELSNLCTELGFNELMENKYLNGCFIKNVSIFHDFFELIKCI